MVLQRMQEVVARTESVRDRKIPVSFGSNPGKIAEKGRKRVVEFLQILEKMASIRTILHTEYNNAMHKEYCYTKTTCKDFSLLLLEIIIVLILVLTYFFGWIVILYAVAFVILTCDIRKMNGRRFYRRLNFSSCITG